LRIPLHRGGIEAGLSQRNGQRNGGQMISCAPRRDLSPRRTKGREGAPRSRLGGTTCTTNFVHHFVHHFVHQKAGKGALLVGGHQDGLCTNPRGGEMLWRKWCPCALPECAIGERCTNHRFGGNGPHGTKGRQGARAPTTFLHQVHQGGHGMKAALIPAISCARGPLCGGILAEWFLVHIRRPRDIGGECTKNGGGFFLHFAPGWIVHKRRCAMG